MDTKLDIRDFSTENPFQNAPAFQNTLVDVREVVAERRKTKEIGYMNKFQYISKSLN